MWSTPQGPPVFRDQRTALTGIWGLLDVLEDAVQFIQRIVNDDQFAIARLANDHVVHPVDGSGIEFNGAHHTSSASNRDVQYA